MKYCPKCKRLYNDEEAVCTCEGCKGKNLSRITDEKEPVYLCSGDVIERDRVQAALSSGSVPSVYTRRMVSANSQLITGMDFDGFDILVPYELYEKAYDIAVGIGAIKPEGEEIIVSEEEEEYEQPPEEMSGSKRTFVRIITAILFIIVCALVIYGTDFITAFIKSLLS